MNDTARKPPTVPKAHPTQRYFQPGHSGRAVSRKLYEPTQCVRVYRNGPDDFAELSIRLGYLGELNALLNPSELRDLASALLDAAHDIESNPAAVLRERS